jgi:hypothetical protein
MEEEPTKKIREKKLLINILSTIYKWRKNRFFNKLFSRLSLNKILRPSPK